MTLHPQAEAILEARDKAGLKPIEELPVADARLLAERSAAVLPVLPVDRVEDRTVPSPTGDVPVRIFWPEHPEGGVVAVYFHGGGWIMGTLDTTDPTARELANLSRAVVVVVGYRLAPEHRYPAAFEDAVTATSWVLANAESLGGRADRVVLVGESAGANLAAAVAIDARDRDLPPCARQILVYPPVERHSARPSMVENAEGYLLHAATVSYAWDQYLGDHTDADDPHATPMVARSLRHLPPALVITAEHDPLRDEGEAYADRLRADGVPVVQVRYPGMFHGFFTMTAFLDAARQAMAEVAAAVAATGQG